MDMATVWLIIGIAGFVFAAIFLTISIVLFVKSRIPTVIGDLNGKTRAREIERIRSENEKSGVKTRHPGTYNANRGPLTSPVTEEKTPQPERPAFVIAHPSKRLDTDAQAPAKPTDVLTPGTTVLPDAQATDVLKPGTTVLDNPDGSKPTTLLDTKDAESTTVLDEDNATTVLSDSGATDVLGEGNATTGLSDSGATDVLGEGNATTVLQDSGATDVLDKGNTTTVLADGGATEALDTESEPTVSLPSAKKPDLLFAGAAPAPSSTVAEPTVQATTVLSDNSAQPPDIPQKVMRFVKVKDIKMIHTDDIIL